MTRKQAISEAIAILSQSNGNEQIIEKLQDILEEMPLVCWTKKSIIDAIENYAIEHNNNLPYEKELISANCLPSNTVIASLFGISSIRKFYSKYLSQYNIKSQRNESPYKDYSVQDFINIFLENYLSIKNKLHVKTVGSRIYDLYRNVGTPCSDTIMRNCKCNTYIELLQLCGLIKIASPLETKLTVTYNDNADWYKEIENIYQNKKREFL